MCFVFMHRVRIKGYSTCFPSLGLNRSISAFVLYIQHLFPHLILAKRPRSDQHLFPCDSFCIFYLTLSIFKFPISEQQSYYLTSPFSVDILGSYLNNVCTAVLYVFQSREDREYTCALSAQIQRTCPSKDHVTWISISILFWHKFFN